MKYVPSKSEKPDRTPHVIRLYKVGNPPSSEDVAPLLKSSDRTCILCCGCVGAGKTVLARNTARAFENVHYFDKDSLSAIAAAGASDASFDRSTDEFMQRFRDAEMDACVNLALEALEFNSHVIMSAPWRLELADLFANKSNARIRRLSEGCRHLNARLVLAFIDIDRDTVVEHLTKRQLVDPQAALRTRGIYEDPDKLQAFLKKQILHAPQGITRLPDVDEFFVFRASDPEGSFGQWKKVLSPVDYDFAFDPDF